MNNAKKLTHWAACLSTWGLYRPRATQRIVAVASQADRVHVDDQNRLDDLLRDLAHSAFKFLPAGSGIAVERLVISAIVSTKSKGNRVMEYDCIKKNGDLESAQCQATQLPEVFPGSWKGGNYTFPMCRPILPESKSEPSRQRGFKSVTELILGF
jgi:hypothetical protein